VTTYSGASASLSFNVTAPVVPAPTLTSISPAIGDPGTSVDVTLTGTNFVSTIGLTASGLVMSNVVLVNSTTITATVVIDSSTAPGAHDVYVTAAGGTTSAVPFTVNAPGALPPSLTSVTPDSGLQGQAVNVTITGTGFTPETTVSLVKVGVSLGNMVVVSPTVITANFKFTANARIGPHSLSVTNAAGTSNILTFTVN
jgi:hypothetical protein